MKRKSSEYTLINAIIGVLVAGLIIGSVVWDAADKPVDTQPPKPKISTVDKSSTQQITIDKVESEPDYTSDELFYIAAAIYNEAGSDNCSDDTRRLVGYVILNRVNDSRFPNTIKGVLEQHRQYGLFYKTGIKFADRHTLPQEQYAVDRAYKIAKEVLETENIPIPATVVFQAEFKQGSSIYKYQDGIYFCHS